MFLFNDHHQGAYYLSFAKVSFRTVHHTHAHTNMDLIKYAATPPNQLQQCILTDYFNNYNFSKLK